MLDLCVLHHCIIQGCWTYKEDNANAHGLTKRTIDSLKLCFASAGKCSADIPIPCATSLNNLTHLQNNLAQHFTCWATTRSQAGLCYQQMCIILYGSLRQRCDSNAALLLLLPPPPPLPLPLPISLPPLLLHPARPWLNVARANPHHSSSPKAKSHCILDQCGRGWLKRGRDRFKI